MPPFSAAAAKDQTAQKEIILIQTTAVPDLPAWEAVLELPGSHHSAEAKTIPPEQTPAGKQIDAAIAADTKQIPDPAHPLNSVLPQAAVTVQAAENVSANATTVHSPPGPMLKEAKLSQLRLEALVNYTHEELQALSNPGGSMGSVLPDTEQKAAAVQPTHVAQAPLLTVMASQLETVSAADAAAEPDAEVGIHQHQQQEQPVSFDGLAQEEERALPEREHRSPRNSSSQAIHEPDTAVAAAQLDRQARQGRLVDSTSESQTPAAASSYALPGLQTGSDTHQPLLDTASEAHPVLQRLMDQAEAQHGANGSQVVHHLMQALHLSGHLHSDQHLPAEHSSLLSTLSHMLHHPTQVSMDCRDACFDLP